MEYELLARYERQFDERYVRPTSATLKRMAKMRYDYEMFGPYRDEEDDCEA